MADITSLSWRAIQINLFLTNQLKKTLSCVVNIFIYILSICYTTLVRIYIRILLKLSKTDITSHFRSNKYELLQFDCIG
jgi:hypothetical protein